MGPPSAVGWIEVSRMPLPLVHRTPGCLPQGRRPALQGLSARSRQQQDAGAASRVSGCAPLAVVPQQASASSVASSRKVGLSARTV